MDRARLDRAMDRIEAALARIETIAHAPANSDPGGAARHAALRNRVGNALRELDTLIAEIAE